MEIQMQPSAVSRIGSMLLACILALSGAVFAAPVFAEEVIEEQVVTGVRGKPRTVQDSPVPIDVFGEQEINDVAFTDMNDVLRTLVPSYGVRRQPISDGATFIRPQQCAAFNGQDARLGEFEEKAQGGIGINRRVRNARS